jgi:hypothetical protein
VYTKLNVQIVMKEMNHPLLKIKITGPEQATKYNFSNKIKCEVATTQSVTSSGETMLLLKSLNILLLHFTLQPRLVFLLVLLL